MDGVLRLAPEDNTIKLLNWVLSIVLPFSDCADFKWDLQKDLLIALKLISYQILRKRKLRERKRFDDFIKHLFVLMGHTQMQIKDRVSNVLLCVDT